jgi:2-polyprenyl-6-methoxyphenol hydroxylase-like FAD-dependent oxidoreductase
MSFRFKFSLFLVIIFSGCCFFLFNGNSATYSSKKKKRAVVSGQSITGMMAALILAKSGYKVDVYEKKPAYTRNIQWLARQSLIDELASIDTELSQLFLEKVARPIYRGSVNIHPNGLKKITIHEKVKEGDAVRIPVHGEEMLAFSTVVTVEAKKFEKFLSDYLSTFPNIQYHCGSIDLKKIGSTYSVQGLGIPDLIVIAEGANSKSRRDLGIQWEMTSPRTHISGVIEIDSGGIMIKHWRNENNQSLLTGAIGSAGSGKTWIVAEIDASTLSTQLQIDEEFRKIAAQCLELGVNEARELSIFGSVEKTSLRLFDFQQGISSVAYAGSNAILIGDAVGTGHWVVGGGMQIGAICHAERLKSLLVELDCGAIKSAALHKYSEGVLQDTKAWKAIKP